MKLIRMTNSEEIVKGSEDRLATWWITDFKKDLLKSLPSLQQYCKDDGAFILAEIEDEVVLDGVYTLGSHDILDKYGDCGMTGLNKNNTYVSISQSDFNSKVKVLCKGYFQTWQDLFDIAKEYGFATGL